MNCSFANPCSLCKKLAVIKLHYAVETPIFTVRVFRLHLHPTPIGRRKYVAVALRRTLGMGR